MTDERRVEVAAEAARAVESQHRHMTSGTPGVWCCTACDWRDGATQFAGHVERLTARAVVAALDAHDGDVRERLAGAVEARADEYIDGDPARRIYADAARLIRERP